MDWQGARWRIACVDPATADSTRGPGVEIAGGRLPDVGWDGHWWDCVLREEMKEALFTFCAWLGDSRACRLIDDA